MKSAKQLKCEVLVDDHNLMMKIRLSKLLSTKFILAMLSLALLSYFTATKGWDAGNWIMGMSIIIAAYFGVNQYQKKVLKGSPGSAS